MKPQTLFVGPVSKERTYEAYGAERQSYDLIGRVPFDYMQLYRKYNYEERHSYRLDYIGEMEVGEKKVVMKEVWIDCIIQ